MRITGTLARSGHNVGRWLGSIHNRARGPRLQPAAPVRIGLALGGGFARGIAHAGILRVFEQHGIEIHCIAGVSAGAIVAAAYASGTAPDEIRSMGCSMRFGDVARWTISRMGLVGSERMGGFLMRLLKCWRFEDMRIPLAIVATDLGSTTPIIFKEQGDVLLPVRASCSYPGLFQPVRYDGTYLVDGAMTMEIPAQAARALGATRVISVHLPIQGPSPVPSNMFQIVNRCFQIMHARTEHSWRSHSDAVIEPDVRGLSWDAFQCGAQMVEAGEKAALAAIPQILSWSASASAPRLGLGTPLLSAGS